VQVAVAQRGPEHPDVALALNNLAILLRKLGRAAEAEPLLHRAVEIERQRGRPIPRSTRTG
jgi:Tfp pilus assembly protein PilF